MADWSLQGPAERWSHMGECNDVSAELKVISGSGQH